jgi:hypothetical protein
MDEVNFADTSTLSVIVHPSKAPTDAYDSSQEHEVDVSTPTKFEPALDPPEKTLRRRSGKEKRRSKKNKLRLLSSIRFGSEDEEEGETSGLSLSLSRRDLSLARLDHEASSRYGSPSLSRSYSVSHSDYSSDSDVSISSSTYSHLDPTGASTDYYPLTLRARYHPRMITQMWSDSAMRHIVTAMAWCRFLLVLGLAMGVAIWQCVHCSFPLCSKRTDEKNDVQRTEENPRTRFKSQTSTPHPLSFLTPLTSLSSLSHTFRLPPCTPLVFSLFGSSFPLLSSPVLPFIVAIFPFFPRTFSLSHSLSSVARFTIHST